MERYQVDLNGRTTRKPGQNGKNRYVRAIARKPSPSSIHGLTTANLGKPDLDALSRQYRNYVDTLSDLGLEIIELEALADFPDSYFVEDTAVVTPEIAVIMRPGAASRRNEPDHLIGVLERFRTTARIESPGVIDGGDVLVVGKHCIIGLSERTNQQGAEHLHGILTEFGYQGDTVKVPEALHLKSSVNFLDTETLLVTRSCRTLDCLSGYQKLVVPDGEEYAANVVWVNDHILIPEGFPGTRQLLEQHGFAVIALPVSEMAKMDGGLTCLSLRLTP